MIQVLDMGMGYSEGNLLNHRLTVRFAARELEPSYMAALILFARAR